MTRDYLKRQEARAAKLSDVGTEQSQPVSYEVVAMLQAENARLKATIEAQQRQLRAFFGCDPSAFDAPTPLPRESAGTAMPVHPPANVTHRGAK